MKNKILIFFPILILASCQQNPPTSFHSAIQNQPYIVSISPQPDHPLHAIDRIELVFSIPVNPDSVNSNSILIVSGEVEIQDSLSPKTLRSKIEDQKMEKIEGDFLTHEDPQKVIWIPKKSVESGNCTLIVTNEILSKTHTPFNQRPGETPTAFISIFRLPTATESEDTSFSTTSSASNTTPPKNRPTFLLINEMLYDALSSDTDGNEFIELHGTASADIDGYQIVILNGADGNILKSITFPANSKINVDGLFLIADSRSSQSTQSNILGANLIENFDPQNGPDAIQLLDHQGRLLDAVAYGSGGVERAQNGLTTGEGPPTETVRAGHSLSRVEGADTNNNTEDFIDLAIPTPGVL